MIPRAIRPLPSTTIPNCFTRTHFDGWKRWLVASSFAAATATTATQSTVPQIFDRLQKRRQRDAVALVQEESRVVDYLRDEVAERLVDRLLVRG